MYRFRFETIEQIFNIPKESQFVFPLDLIYKQCLKENGINEIYKAAGYECFENAPLLIAELPAIIWEGDIENTKKKLSAIKTVGINDILCENIGALDLAQNFKLHGGMYLNILNSVSADYYLNLGFEDVCLSFEMPFSKIRNLKMCTDNLSLVIYGYLPLMKFRACPAMGKNGCKDCNRDNYLTDRKGEKFRIFCRNSKYSELLNCVPLYVGDKSLPKLNIYTYYYTVESKQECEKVFLMTLKKEAPDFRRTAGLYNRELL